MAARVFRLDELASRIAAHLLVVSPRSTVALALTCKALEVPALRTLWGRQCTLSSLIERVMPGLQRPPTTLELSRLKRYASWIRRLEVREWGITKELTRLVLPSSDGTPPALPLHLQGLVWSLNETSLPFLLNFLSPHLTKVAITTDELRHPDERVGSWLKLPDEVVPVMRSAIKIFPPSIQDICLKLGNGPETRLTEEVSAYVLRCGEALRRFATNVVLSTEAIVHLMKLPNLETWATEQGPPQVSDLINHGVPDGVTSLFPSLQALDLRSEVASKWLPLFEVAKGRTPPWIMAGDSLPMICYDDPTLPIDLSMVSKFLPFTDLVELRIRMECMYGGPCISKLTDKDVERMAIALPKLEALSLGEWPCDSDSCPTTIRSLLFLSINCTKLRYLNIHFRTTVLRADMLDLLGDARSQGLRSKPRCALRTLVTRNMRLVLFDYDPVLVSMGLLMIFPSLDMLITSWGTPWVLLDSMVKVMRQVEVIPDLTEELMICLNEAREQADGGVPTRSANEIARTICGPLSWVVTKAPPNG